MRQVQSQSVEVLYSKEDEIEKYKWQRPGF